MKNIKETIKNIIKEESEYQQFFRKALEKAGKSIPAMSDDEKKAFFNKIDAAWDGKGEKNEGNTFGAAVTKAKEEGDDEFTVDGKTYPVKESVNEGKKVFKVNPGIGKAKYSISSHDGKKTHKDGSDFYDIEIFNNKVDLEKGIKKYTSNGFVKESVNEVTTVIKTKDGKLHNYPNFKKNDVINFLTKKGMKHVSNEKDLKSNMNFYIVETVNESSQTMGHWVKSGSQTLVDSNFVNASKGVLPNSRLVHMGGGDFALKTSEGEITFDRVSNPSGIADDFVGRAHRMMDTKNGKLLNALIAAMAKSKQAVASMSETTGFTSFKPKFSVNENFSNDDIAKIKGAVEGASSFMGIGSELKKLGMKYDFSTSPLPVYMVKKGNKTFVLINKKYAEKPDFVVGDTAGGLLEGNLSEGFANPKKTNPADLAKTVLGWFDFATDYIDDGGQRRQAEEKNDDTLEWFESHPTDIKEKAYKIIISRAGADKAEVERTFGKRVKESVNETKFKAGDKVVISYPMLVKPIKGVVSTILTDKGEQVLVLKGKGQGVWDAKFAKLDESINEGKQRFYQQDGIGKSKYTISYHDGTKKHKDGSDFYDIKIFKNKIDLENFRGELLKKGYREDTGGKTESVNEGNAFGMAVTAAKKEGKSEFEFNGKTYKVKKGSYEKNEAAKKAVTENTHVLISVNKRGNGKLLSKAVSQKNAEKLKKATTPIDGEELKVLSVADFVLRAW
jgi:hypothetical protein